MVRPRMNIPRVVIAGLGSGCGKTTVSTGLMGAFASTGLRVQGFKVGPDFIDPTYHTMVTDRKSRNLDAWMLPERTIQTLFQSNVAACDIAIVEGVMGLFDGTVNSGGSTAHIAKLLGCPVILVLDVWGMAGSAAALVAGCKALDKRLNLAGVILNRVSGEKHAAMCTRAIESATKMPVVGALHRDHEVKLPERHLGLVPTTEDVSLRTKLDRISGLVKSSVDLNRVLEIGKSAPPLAEASFKRVNRRKTVRIGVAYDAAFSFYYQDALDALSAAGAELGYFSPLHDRTLPEDFDGLYIGGGFPEVLAKELESNQPIRSSIKKRVEQNIPVFAECGGLMYLTKSIADFQGAQHTMVGILDCKTKMVGKLTLNYTHASVLRNNMLSNRGTSIRGHEFHYSRLDDVPSDACFAYLMKRGSGIDAGRDGWVEYGALAQYMHMNFAAYPKLTSNFIKTCARYRRK